MVTKGEKKVTDKCPKTRKRLPKSGRKNNVSGLPAFAYPLFVLRYSENTFFQGMPMPTKEVSIHEDPLDI